MNYRLHIDGDDWERYCWGLFIRDKFPIYESFWLKYVVPVTNRPENVHFKNDKELQEIDKSPTDIVIAQLSYTMIRHLGRCFEILKILESDFKPSKAKDFFKRTSFFVEFFSRLIGAQDNAFELFEMKENPGIYINECFDKNSKEKARKNWQEKNSKILEPIIKPIKRYRNNLIHGILQVSITGEGKLCFPKIGTEDWYFDWRIITDHSAENYRRREDAKKDFISDLEITKEAWSKTINYFKSNFEKIIKEDIN